MNDFGADKGCVLAISWDGEDYITDEEGYVLIFNTYREIKDWAKENGYNYEEFFLHEVHEIPDDGIDEIEF